MISNLAAGLLLYRRVPDGLEVLIVHPGGPFWARKDLGAWSIPKGRPEDGEDPADAAGREFTEELGSAPPPPPWVDLGRVRQKAGKVVVAFAAEGDLDVSAVVSNTVEIEWPAGSGRRITFPEVDRAEWFDLDEASRRLNPAQIELLERLRDAVGPHSVP